jgi:hypothetical protein
VLLLFAVRLVAAQLGWQVVPAGSADSQWDLFWTDTSISQERLLRLAPTQVRSQQQQQHSNCTATAAAETLHQRVRLQPNLHILDMVRAAVPPSCLQDRHAVPGSGFQQ